MATGRGGDQALHHVRVALGADVDALQPARREGAGHPARDAFHAVVEGHRDARQPTDPGQGRGGEDERVVLAAPAGEPLVEPAQSPVRRAARHDDASWPDRPLALPVSLPAVVAQVEGARRGQQLTPRRLRQVRGHRAVVVVRVHHLPADASYRLCHHLRLAQRVRVGDHDDIGVGGHDGVVSGLAAVERQVRVAVGGHHGVADLGPEVPDAPVGGEAIARRAPRDRYTRGHYGARFWACLAAAQAIWRSW
jgi:hypothetical protein